MSEPKTYTIAYALDSNYVDLTAVSLASAAKNLPKGRAKFVVMHSSLGDGEIETLSKCAAAAGAQIEFVRLDAEKFKKLPLSFWVGIEAWFRIEIPRICAGEERVLYLDCDTLVAGDIAQLWQVDLSGAYVGAVRDIWNVKKYAARLEMESEDYFNSGVLLINCAKWRADGLAEKLYAYAASHKVEFCDQDTLNKVIDARKVMLPLRCNYLEPWWRGGYHEYSGKWEEQFEVAKKSPLIIHYTGPKPLNKYCRHSFAGLWWKCAQTLPIYPALRAKYEASRPPKTKQPPLKNIFFIGNEFSGGKKRKILRLLGMTFTIKKY